MNTTVKRPVVGLFLDSAVVYNLKRQRDLHLVRLNMMREAGERAGVTLVVFSVDDVSFFPQERMRGVTYDPLRERWVGVNMGMPDVLYDRFVGLPFQIRKADYIRSEMNKRGVKKINSRPYFDKYDLIKELALFDRVSPHLPFTRILQDITELEKVFAVRTKLYIKSAVGARGKQVMSAARLPGGGYSYSYFNEKLFLGNLRDISELQKIISAVCGNKNVIVQEAVNVIKLDNRVVDLRGELQRNGKNELEVIVILVRVGRDNSPIATHGDSYTFEQFFRTYLRYSQDEIQEMRQSIEEFLVETYKSIEKVYGPFGEIAIDFGLDRQGKIWIFEGNAKSMRVSLCNAADRKTISKAFMNPFLYARYLCGLPG